MTKQTFSGKTLDDAIDAAARGLGVDRISVSYSLQEQSGGLLSKLFSKGVKIEAWVEHKQDLKQAARDLVRQTIAKDKDSERERPRKERSDSNQRNRLPKEKTSLDTSDGDEKAVSARQTNQRSRPRNEKPAPHRRPRQERPERPVRRMAENENEDSRLPSRPSESFNNPDVRRIFEEYVDEFTKCFSISKENARVEFSENGRARLIVEDEFLENSLARTDRISSAFEHIFKRIVQKKCGDVADRVSLEAGRSVELREEKLQEMAHALAEKVRRSGRPVKVAAKSSQERRVIHMALDGAEGVATKSVGSGEHRRLIIFSTNPEHKRPPRHQTDGTASGSETPRQAGAEGGAPRRRRRRRGGRKHGQNRFAEGNSPQNNESGDTPQDSSSEISQ